MIITCTSFLLCIKFWILSLVVTFIQINIKMIYIFQCFKSV